MLRVAYLSYILLELIWTAKETITTPITVSQQGKDFDWEGILVTKLEEAHQDRKYTRFLFKCSS